MKKTNFKGLWTAAPINGKDVNFDFIEENISDGGASVISDANRFALYSFKHLVEVVNHESHISVRSDDLIITSCVVDAIVSHINDIADNSIFATVRNPESECQDINFWWTDFEILSEEDVCHLFNVIYEDLGLTSMHPDDDADAFVSDTFSKEDADQLDNLLIEAERWCSEHDRDIYHIALRRLTKAIERKKNENK